MKKPQYSEEQIVRILRAALQTWMQQLWLEKDAPISKLLSIRSGT
jgi:hypothetical protein